jgi:predicted NBD/HSP70 family sugar kinase
MDLVRALTDEHILRALIRHRRLTRAELAIETGISKPTVGESVRRLSEIGLVADTGERTPGGRGRGRVGSYYALATDVGTALAASIAPDGVVAEQVNPHGETIARAEREISRPAGREDVAAALAAAVAELRPDGRPAPCLAVVSAADPVDRRTGKLVQLPDAPFLVGELDPGRVLAPHVNGPVTADNDVNWAARAERQHAGGTMDHAAYLYLGEGLGCALISDGEVRRGGAGLAGELAHLVTTGPDGDATRFIDVFGALGLRQYDSTAIDVDRLIAAATGPGTQPATRGTLAQAIGGIVAAIVGLANPDLIIIGGPWGSQPAILDAVSHTVAHLPRPVPIQAAHVTTEPSLTGARTDAINQLREAIIALANDARTEPVAREDPRSRSIALTATRIATLGS